MIYSAYFDDNMDELQKQLREKFDARDFEGALLIVEQILKLSPNNCEAWINRGEVLSDLGRKEEALLCFEQAITISYNHDNAWLNKGLSLFNLSLYKDALLCFEWTIGINRRNDIAWYNTITATQFLSGYEEAKSTYKIALGYITEELNPLGWAKITEAMGDVHYKEGNRLLWNQYTRAQNYYSLALQCYEQALQKIQELSQKQVSEKGFTLITKRLDILKKTIKTLYQLEEQEQAQTLIREGSDLVQHLVDSCGSKGYGRKIALDYSSFNQLNVNGLIQEGKIIPALETAEKNKNSCLKWFFGEDDTESILQWQDMKELLDKLSNNVAIIYFHCSPVSLCCFILHQSYKQPCVVSLTKEQFNQWERWSKTWNDDYHAYKKRESLIWQTAMPSRLDELGKIMRGEEIVNQLPSEVNQLIIVPHRHLHLYPLHSLFSDNYDISNFPSLRAVVSALESSSQQSETIIALEGNDPRLKFIPLEMDKVVNVYPHAQVLSLNRDNFSLDQLRKNLSNGKGNLHYSGHGISNFRNPSESALVFESHQDGEEVKEYKLTAGDIYHSFGKTIFSNYDTVTLSACEVGCAISESITAEYVGLSTVLLACGTQTVISPLWNVRDDFSTILMIEFHRQIIEEGTKPYQALKKVKKWLASLTNAQLREYLSNLKEDIQVLTENNNRSERDWVKMKRYISEIRRTLQGNDEKPFNHPYYLGAFVCHGSIFS